jgi:cobyrinic acid a,c-diamide synthase
MTPLPPNTFHLPPATSHLSPTFSAFCIAGTHSGVGKTTLTLGLLAALRRRGLAVQPFKCGPDYIDPGHHRQACGVASRNLDTWMMGEAGVRETYARAASQADVAIIEGVMGLFDGASPDRLEGSSAHVCQRLDIPVILVVNAKAMARSIAPLVKGFAEFEPGVRVVGVIANNVSTESHARTLVGALAASGLPPLLGCLPPKPEWRLPERHLGLISDTEAGIGADWFQALADGVEQHIDIDQLLRLCETNRPSSSPPLSPVTSPRAPSAVRLGIARDAAFHFYYEDNLDRLRDAGAELIPFSPLTDAALPADLDGLYIGGGFPEMFARTLADNMAMRASVRAFAATGPVYAECGGLMYLGRTLTDGEGRSWDMCGALPVHTGMGARVQRLGYVEATTLAAGPLGPQGTVLRGHEFHWSSVVREEASLPCAYAARFVRTGEIRETGLAAGHVWASYLHFHFASQPAAAQHWVSHLRAHRLSLHAGGD